MYNFLNISITSSDSIIYAKDYTDYAAMQLDLSLYNSIELIFYKNTDEVVDIKINKNLFSECSQINLQLTELKMDKDGTYQYIKMLVPTIDKFKQNGKYINTKGQLFIHDGNIYVSNSNEIELEDILLNSDEFNSYFELYEYLLTNKSSQTFYFPKANVATWHNLTNCWLNLQTAEINNGINYCELNNETANRNFILAALFILQQLNCKNDYAEIDRILENINSCNLCNKDNYNIKSCNCN